MCFLLYFIVFKAGFTFYFCFVFWGGVRMDWFICFCFFKIMDLLFVFILSYFFLKQNTVGKGYFSGVCLILFFLLYFFVFLGTSNFCFVFWSRVVRLGLLLGFCFFYFYYRSPFCFFPPRFLFL